MWPSLEEIRTLSRRMQMAEDLVLPAEKSRQLKTPPLGEHPIMTGNGFYSEGKNGVTTSRQRVKAVNPLHGPSMLMPEISN